MALKIGSIEEFHSLLNYYISCLEKEDTKSLNFNYRLDGKKFYSKIFKKEEFFSQKKLQIEMKKTPEIDTIFKNYELLQKNMPVFYGYPLFMDSNGNISPVFFVKIIPDEKENIFTFTKDDVKIEFNHYILTNQGYDVEQIKKYCSDIDEEKDFSIKLDTIKKLLKLDKEVLSSELDPKPLIVTSSPHLRNKAILYFGEKIGFTKGLIDELQRLKDKTQHQLESTSLGILFNKEKHETPENKKDILEIFNLNEPQEGGVKNAFSSNISVITGPPGTGKSQVVLNIIANAVWNDKTVLFASKNNRAVDVVNDKLKTILSEDLVVRMGSGERKKKVKLQIRKIFQDKNSLKLSPNFEENRRGLSSLNVEIYKLKAKICYLSNLNTKIDEHYEKINTIIDLLPSELKQEAQDKAYLFLDKLSINGDISSIDNLISSIKILNETIRREKDNLRAMITQNNMPSKLHYLFEGHEYGNIDELDLNRDIGLLCMRDSLIKRIIKGVFPKYFLNQEYSLFRRYYELLDQDIQNYFNKHTQFNSQSIRVNLELILTLKRLSQIKKEICRLDNDEAKLVEKKESIFIKYLSQLPCHANKFIESNTLRDDNFVKQFLSWMLVLKDRITLSEEINTIKNQVLSELPFDILQLKIANLQEERIKLSRPLFEDYWFKKIKQISPQDENHVFRYIDALEKLETHVDDPILWRQLIEVQESEMSEMLSFLPIWVVTNLSAKNSFPLKENLFDLLIIDEASQCDIASALPLLFRAKQVVIIGDPNQLKHISLLSDIADKKIASGNKISGLYSDYAYSRNSLYEIAERTIKSKDKLPILLNYHYRSHKDIISFPNEHFYDNKLNIMTDESNLIPDGIYPNGIKWFDVCGKTKNLSNEEEAIKVISILKEYQKSNLNKKSFGVVTLFRAQAELIEGIKNKAKELKDMDITVGTAHRFQGDEKDIIIFSSAISQGIKQAALHWIHTTTQLLNVAITRARSLLIVVGDKKKFIEAGGYLKSLVEHAESKTQSEPIFDSDIEYDLDKRLKKEGIKVLPQHETRIRNGKPYRLDFALFINNTKYDIEVDGDKAHSQKIESDLLRDIHLRMDGWKIRRFPASEIYNNLDKVIEEIKRLC